LQREEGNCQSEVIFETNTDPLSVCTEDHFMEIKVEDVPTHNMKPEVNQSFAVL